MARNWMQGALHPAWTIIWWSQDEQGKLARKDLTGLDASNFSLKLHPMDGSADVVGGGTFTVVSASEGVIQYQPAAADVATAKAYQLLLIASFPGSLPDISLPYPLTILGV